MLNESRRNASLLISALCAGAMLWGCADPTEPEPLAIALTSAPPRGTTETQFLLAVEGFAEVPDTPLECRWDLDGDGDWDTEWSASPTRTHRYDTPGLHPVRCEARLVGGKHGTATVAVDVLDPDETGWQSFGSFMGEVGYNQVATMTPFGDPVLGEVLVVGGDLDWETSPMIVGNIVAWDGTEWFNLGLGLTRDGNAPDPVVAAMAVYEGRLIVGGSFTTAGGEPAAHVASWDGTTWRALGEGFDGSVLAVVVHDGELYAGGRFTHSGAAECLRIARWTGSTWDAVDGGFPGTVPWTRVRALCSHDGELLAGGAFEGFGGSMYDDNLARLVEGQWRPFETSVTQDNTVNSLASDGERLLLGQWDWENDGGHVAIWSGGSWSIPDQGVSGSGDDTEVCAVGFFEGDPVITGRFRNAGGDRVRHIARLSDGQWTPLASGLDINSPELFLPGGFCLAEFQQSLLVGGEFVGAVGLPSANLLQWITPPEL